MPLSHFCFYARNTCETRNFKPKINVMLAISGGTIYEFIASINVFYGIGALPKKHWLLQCCIWYRVFNW